MPSRALPDRTARNSAGCGESGGGVRGGGVPTSHWGAFRVALPGGTERRGDRVLEAGCPDILLGCLPCGTAGVVLGSGSFLEHEAPLLWIFRKTLDLAEWSSWA